MLSVTVRNQSVSLWAPPLLSSLVQLSGVAFPSNPLRGTMPIVLRLRYWPLTWAEPLAQRFLFWGIPLMLVQQPFPVTCLVTLSDCAWGQGLVGDHPWCGRPCPGVYRMCAGVCL